MNTDKGTDEIKNDGTEKIKMNRRDAEDAEKGKRSNTAGAEENRRTQRRRERSAPVAGRLRAA
jgi:hypothetical protein